MITLIRVRSISIITRRPRTKSLFIFQFSADVLENDIEKLFLEEVKLTSLTCTGLKTKSYASFHIQLMRMIFLKLIIQGFGQMAA